MSELTFTIVPDLWLTSNRVTLNRAHRARIVRDLQTLSVAVASLARLRPITNPVSLTWTVRYPKGVRTDKGDPVNASSTTKPLLDGLVPHWLPDDGPLYVRAETFTRGPNLTVARLHEITLTITEETGP